MEKGKVRILVGRDAKAVDLMVRLIPRLYPRLVARAAQRILAKTG